MTQQEINKKIRVSLAFFFSVSLALIFSLTVQSAELGITSQFQEKFQEIGIGQQFQVDLFLDTKNEEINAVEGKIVLPENLLEVKEIRDGNSIVNFWIEKPKASNGEILFSGIIPGGYLGERGLIFSIVFQSKKEGEGTIEIVKARTLLNDGKGTEAPLTISNFQFSVTHELPRIETPIDTKKDTEPPETFRPEIAKDESMFDGKWFLVFATQDKSAGIADYAIHETTRRKHELTPTGEITPIATKIDEKDWILAESPYLLKDQKLRSYIYVKAVDKAGNERIEMLSPQKPLAWYENYLIWVIIIIGLIIACLIYLIGQNLWRRKITRHE